MIEIYWSIAYFRKSKNSVIRSKIFVHKNQILFKNEWKCMLNFQPIGLIHILIFNRFIHFQYFLINLIALEWVSFSGKRLGNMIYVHERQECLYTDFADLEKSLVYKVSSNHLTYDAIQVSIILNSCHAPFYLFFGRPLGLTAGTNELVVHVINSWDSGCAVGCRLFPKLKISCA